MKLSIAVSSGKGGTGKTFVSTNIARAFENLGEPVRYLDCDVEEPNGHLFLKPVIEHAEDVTLLAPAGADPERCTACGKCAAACAYHALALIKDSVLFFKNLCHICGACSLVCPEKAIREEPRKIGRILRGKSGAIECAYGLLETGEGGMTPRLIRKVKEFAGEGVNILDSPPGTSCPVVETVKHADLCVLVTDPTPFGINDLKLAVNMCRELDKEPVIVVNRAEYFNGDLKDYCGRERLEIIGEIPDERKIAECYSVGDLAGAIYPEYGTLFRELALKMSERALRPRPVTRKPTAGLTRDGNAENIECQAAGGGQASAPGREVVVISGKGGTGKTSLAASFAALEKNIAIADCDVDAADLHLVLKPEVREKGLFSGGRKALINETRCTGCAACLRACRFNAVIRVKAGGSDIFRIDRNACEGCGVCALVCRFNAIELKPVVNGRWFVSETRFGPMAHAELGIAEENSGKLVSLIRGKKNSLAAARKLEWSLSDGSPGTGCPVIASITGADYAAVVTEPTVSGVHDLARILDVIRHFNMCSGVIVNKFDLNIGKTDEIRDMAKKSGADFLGVIPYDKIVTEAQMKGLAVVEYADSPMTDKIKEIWRAVKKHLEKE